MIDYALTDFDRAGDSNVSLVNFTEFRTSLSDGLNMIACILVSKIRTSACSLLVSAYDRLAGFIHGILLYAGTPIEQIDGTLSNGTRQNARCYIAPFATASHEDDYRIAWAFFDSSMTMDELIEV